MNESKLLVYWNLCFKNQKAVSFNSNFHRYLFILEAFLYISLDLVEKKTFF